MDKKSIHDDVPPMDSNMFFDQTGLTIRAMQGHIGLFCINSKIIRGKKHTKRTSTKALNR